MPASNIEIPGLTTNDKTPGVYTNTRYNQGAGASAAPVAKVLLVGNPTSGTRAANTGPWPVISEDHADEQFGVGSELSTMCYAALEVDGVEIWAYPVPEPGSGTA